MDTRCTLPRQHKSTLRVKQTLTARSNRVGSIGTHSVYKENSSSSHSRLALYPARKKTTSSSDSSTPRACEINSRSRYEGHLRAGGGGGGGSNGSGGNQAQHRIPHEGFSETEEEGSWLLRRGPWGPQAHLTSRTQVAVSRARWAWHSEPFSSAFSCSGYLGPGIGQRGHRAPYSQGPFDLLQGVQLRSDFREITRILAVVPCNLTQVVIPALDSAPLGKLCFRWHPVGPLGFLPGLGILRSLSSSQFNVRIQSKWEPESRPC